jgi:chorismate synthase
VVNPGAANTDVARSIPDTAPARYEIRHVRTHDEFVQCVALQAATWGADFRELVPATILKITQRLGGVTAGAFTPEGELLGFVFGVTGVEHGSIVHWSDMLAVDARAQNHGIGRRLKAFQREAVRAIGATRMYWTFDPLVARNAHFNLNRLGAHVAEYVEDMYGADTGSALHSGLGTDRFVVVWPIAPDNGVQAQRAATPAAGWRDTLVLNADNGSATDLRALADSPPARARVEVPADIRALQHDRVDEAVQWRQSTRRALQWGLRHGYSIAQFDLEPATARGYYLLERTPGTTSRTP